MTKIVIVGDFNSVDKEPCMESFLYEYIFCLNFYPNQRELTLSLQIELQCNKHWYILLS